MSVVDFKSDNRITATDRAVLREFCSALGGDPAQLAAHLGVKVFEKPMDTTVDGYIQYDPAMASASGYIVVLNMHKPVARKKFTLAHELGHYVLHRGSEEFQDSKVRSAEVFDFPCGFRSGDDWDAHVLPRWMEREADRFAAAVLLPMGAVRRSPEYQNNDPAMLAQQLDMSPDFVTRRFEETCAG